ncbi:MAG: hypothetical protein J6S13_04540 [Clostridia bacterium]|nr:hypothetical protein [Clostridia bacterium]
MKKIIAIVLCLVFLVIAGCNTMPFGHDEANVGSTAFDKSSVSSSSSISSGALSSDNSSDISSLISSYDGVSSFDDFADKFDKDNKLNKTENEDGSVTIDIKNPTIEPDGGDDDTSPAIPTIDKVTPKPDTDDTSSNSSSDSSSNSSSKTSSGATSSNSSSKTNSSGSTSSKDTSSGSASSKDTVTSSESSPSSRPETPASSSSVTSSEPKKTYYTYTTGQTHRKLHYTERYLYSILTEEQKSWYRAIDTAVNTLEASAVINADLAENRNYYIYFLYMADNPEHFYLGNTVSIYTKAKDITELSFCYSDGENYCAYGHTPSRITPELRDSILQKKSEFDAEVKRIISTIPSAAPDVEKEKLIYDRILLDSHYNLSARWNGVCESNWNAYGILVNKYGVCESYSEAFQTLCFAVGINCAGVVGTAGGGHKWNVVELDGEWYMCDITFDDPIGGDPDDAYHYYFNRTSAEMTEDNHNWENCDWPVPDCKGTKYSYKNYFGR